MARWLKQCLCCRPRSALTLIGAGFTLWQAGTASSHNTEVIMTRKSVIAAMLATFAVLTVSSSAYATTGGLHAVHAVSMCGGGMSMGSDSC